MQIVFNSDSEYYSTRRTAVKCSYEDKLRCVIATRAISSTDVGILSVDAAGQSKRLGPPRVANMVHELDSTEEARRTQEAFVSTASSRSRPQCARMAAMVHDRSCSATRETHEWSVRGRCHRIHTL